MIRRYELDILKALQGKKINASEWEAKEWKKRLNENVLGHLYAREGTVVETPVGKINTYLDEESHLIGKHLPPLNRSNHK